MTYFPHFPRVGLLGKFLKTAVLSALATILSEPSARANTEDFTVSPGLSAHWYDPARSGEGLVLEILDEDSALIYWFTYDESGAQRWLIDVGNIEGNEIVFPQLTVTSGGRFGPDFDPDDVEQQVVGDAVLSFSDCDTAQWSYSAFGHSETLEMNRLTQTMAAGCQPAEGVPGQPVKEYAGQSGSWYDPTQAGHGYTLQWMSRDEAVLIWFTYDIQGNQYWVLGTGRHADGRIVFTELNTTRGPQFGEGFDSADLEISEWGELTLEIDCEEGTAVWESAAGAFGAGELDLERLTALDRPPCPYQAPKFTDLFEVEYTEIPLVDPPSDPNEAVQDGNIVATDVALDGTVVAYRRISGGEAEALRWSPGDQQPEAMPDVVWASDVLIAPDSSYVAATLRETDPNDDLGGLLASPAMWADDGQGWQPLVDGADSPLSLIYGSSQDGKGFVGRGRNLDHGDNSREPWLYTEDSGQVYLPLGEDMQTGTAYALSNDGRVVVGHQLSTSSGPRREFATRWIDGGEPEILEDQFGAPLAWSFTCNHDCSVIAGGSQGGEPDSSHPHYKEAWIRTSGGNITYLGSLPDAVMDSHIPPYLAFDITDDGSLFVGRYLAVGDDNSLHSEGLIWTQATGLVSVSDLLSELDLSDNNWDSMEAIAVTPDGRHVLLSGAYGSPPHFTLGRYGRAAILALYKK